MKGITDFGALQKPLVASGRMFATVTLLTLVSSVSGTPYISGGDSPRGTDCSGLVSWVSNAASGRPIYGDRFNTGNIERALLARGFKYGTQPAALTGGDRRAVGQRGGGVTAVPPDVEGAGLRPVLEAAGEQSPLDIAGVEPVAVDRSASCRISDPRNQARAVRAPGRVPAGDVRRARNRAHERQQRYGSKHAAGRY